MIEVIVRQNRLDVIVLSMRNTTVGSLNVHGDMRLYICFQFTQFLRLYDQPAKPNTAFCLYISIVSPFTTPHHTTTSKYESKWFTTRFLHCLFMYLFICSLKWKHVLLLLSRMDSRSGSSHIVTFLRLSLKAQTKAQSSTHEPVLSFKNISVHLISRYCTVTLLRISRFRR